jgi:fluoride exporter
MSGLAWIAFLMASATGAVARHVLDGWVRDRTGDRLPWGILAVNLSGCLLAGVVFGLGLDDPGGTPRTIVATGGLGAYTTFSTFTVDTVRLAQEGELRAAARNVAGTVGAGLAATSAGLALTGLG